MRKIIVLLITTLLITGCSSKPEVTPTKAPVVTPTQDELIPNEDFMNGDFSSIAGDYININGDVITINSEGLNVNGNEFAESELHFGIDGSYHRNVVNTTSRTGLLMIIYPVGVEVEYYETATKKILVKSDTTKVRISYGNAETTKEEEIYTKK